MRVLDIPKGTKVLIATPARPMPENESNALGELIRGIHGVKEAYLPYCHVQGMTEKPAQILVLVLDSTADVHSALKALGDGLFDEMKPGGEIIDVWPMTQTNPLLASIRGTRTHIHCAPPPKKKPWWAVFGF
jgi:hypothetical protein